ncbi:MAG TPA: efflux RND transporter periplasmic adaptor subunit [Gemmatales bacterium]|nr:efflux RND transporter periplasmic adaptor subunit [Gemmatales bacterium]
MTVSSMSPQEPASVAKTPIQRKPGKRGLWTFLTLIVLAGAGGAVWYFWGEAIQARWKAQPVTTSVAGAGIKTAGIISVNTVHPVRKTLIRQLEQAGSIMPEAQAELFAKVPGYLKLIQRELTPLCVAQLVSNQLNNAIFAPLGSPVQFSVQGLGCMQHSWMKAPLKNLGSVVREGEVIMMLDVPELKSDIAQKMAVLQQREAELMQNKAMLLTYEAGLEAAVSKQKSAVAELHRAQAECDFRQGELERMQSLVKERTVTEELVAEKRNQTNAAKAACEAAQAKIDAEKAEYSVASSKLIAARADLLVKQALVAVAREDLERARALAQYGVIRAPFDGVITARNVDEGDFIQNASSGQSMLLMTVTALDQVRVSLQVPEKEAALTRVGTEAVIRFDAHEQQPITGKVSRTARSLDTQARTMRIEVDLDNADHKLMPGMYGHVTLILQRHENAMAIPATAVFSRRGENYIVLADKGVARRVPVHIRFDNGEELEVVTILDQKEVPLTGKEELIVSNKGEIGDGQRIKAIPLGKNGR